jgi:hypothetical protein
MKIDLWHQCRQSISETPTEAPEIFVDEPAFCVRFEGDPPNLRIEVSDSGSPCLSVAFSKPDAIGLPVIC